MAVYSVKDLGSVGLMSDVNPLIAPPNAWTEAKGVRYQDGLVLSMPAFYLNAFTTTLVPPYHLCPVVIGVLNYMIYAGQNKIYVTRVSEHVNLTRQSGGFDVDYAAIRNGWTSTLLSGIPILAHGREPQSWDLNLANRFAILANWPASTYAQCVRSYKNYLIALGITKGGVSYPHMVKWSHPADPGSVPSSWDHTNPAVDAGEYDIGDSWDTIVDGLSMGDSFIIYKRNSVWRMDWIGGPYIFRFTKLFNNFGALTKNCIVEHNGMHIVVTSSDIIIHDGRTYRSLLDGRTRLNWMESLGWVAPEQTFAVKNVLHNEIWVIYPDKLSPDTDTEVIRINLNNWAISSSSLYGASYAATGFINAIANPWKSKWTKDNVPIHAPRLSIANVFDSKIRVADGGDVDEPLISDTISVLHRNGIDLELPNRRKLITSIIPKIYGTAGTVINVNVCSLANPDDPNGTFVVSKLLTYTIGTTIDCPALLEGRYFSVRFSGNSNPQWALESYDIIYQDVGEW